MDGWTEVGPLEDLREGKGSQVVVDLEKVLLVRSGERVFAVEDTCTHQGAPLHMGPVKTGSLASVTCPLHGSTFGLQDGRVLRGPATEPLLTYETKVEAGTVFLRPA
ncbi:MAG: Rieske 2Fe-2S domain-containing protein [Actinomycetota bacterium]